MVVSFGCCCISEDYFFQNRSDTMTVPLTRSGCIRSRAKHHRSSWWCFRFMKVKDFLHEFVTHLEREGKRPRTIICHKQMLFKAILNSIGDIDIKKLKKTDRALVLEKARLQGATAPRRAILTLRALLRYVTDRGHELAFDWRDLEIPKMVDRPVVVLDREEIIAVRQALEYLPDVFWAKRRRLADLRNRAMFELALHSGMRISECINANRDDIDFNKEEIRLVNVKTHEVKQKSIVGATKYLLDYLSERDDEDPALFVSAGNFGKGCHNPKRLTFDGAKSAFRELRKRLGLKKHFHFHMLRKTYVTLLLLNGVDIKSVQKEARHKSERTTLRYYSYVNDESRWQPT